MTKHKLLPEIEVTIPKGATHYRGFINQQPSWYKSGMVENKRRIFRCARIDFWVADFPN